MVPEIDRGNNERHTNGEENREETFVETPGHPQSKKGDGAMQ